jgi:uncharacterized protein
VLLAGSEPADRGEPSMADLEKLVSALVGSEPAGRKYHATEFFAEPKVAELAEAARDGDVDRVNALVTQGIKPNARGQEGLTPLMYAMSGKTRKGFQRLLELGGDPNLQTERGESAVSFAAHRQESESLKLVLAHGGNPNLRSRPDARYTDDSTPTPIFHAIRGRNSENARILIKAGADLNARNSYGLTPLAEAAVLRAFDVMYVLLEAGADLRAKDNNGLSVSYYVLTFTINFPKSDLAKSREKCMEFMRKKGIDFEKERLENAEIKRRAEEEQERESEEQSRKKTP